MNAPRPLLVLVGRSVWWMVGALEWGFGVTTAMNGGATRLRGVGEEGRWGAVDGRDSSLRSE